MKGILVTCLFDVQVWSQAMENFKHSIELKKITSTHFSLGLREVSVPRANGQI